MEPLPVIVSIRLHGTTAVEGKTFCHVAPPSFERIMTLESNIGAPFKYGGPTIKFVHTPKYVNVWGIAYPCPDKFFAELIFQLTPLSVVYNEELFDPLRQAIPFSLLPMTVVAPFQKGG